MPPIERARSSGARPPTDLSYEDVRRSFLTRLQGEQIRLEFLSATLGASGDDTAAAFCELERFAHRLRGAAAVFGVPPLCEAAKALELLAADAALKRAPNNDPRVKSAVHILAARLDQLNGGAPSAEIALASLNQ